MDERPNNKWYRLDNAATIVPSTVHGSDTRVFRIVCELKEEVDGDILQDALDQTIDEFPHYNVILRKGFFWYYLDSTRLRATVTEDDRPALEPLYLPGRRSLMYRVSYFKKRINLEMFHVLADGTGAFTFMRVLVANYLRIAHDIPMSLEENELMISATAGEKNNDAFVKFYSKERSRQQLRKMMKTDAYQIEQDKDANLQSRLIEGVTSASGFVALAHRYNTTAGILTVALYIEAVLGVMSVREQKHPIVISVPVNLRQYFPSETTRNFFGVINVPFRAKEYDGTIESIIDSVRESFEEQLTEENLRDTMNGYSGLSQNIAIKVIPLFIKDPVVNILSRVAQQGTTATMSNLGRIKMPPEFEPYILQFSAFMATPNMQICVSSFGDRMVFGGVSAYAEHFVLVNFFRGLTKRGLRVEIATNDNDVNPEEKGISEKKQKKRRKAGGNDADVQQMQDKDKGK